MKKATLLVATIVLLAGCLFVASCGGDPTLEAQPRLRSEAPQKGTWYFSGLNHENTEIDVFSFTLNEDGTVTGELPNGSIYPHSIPAGAKWTVVTTSVPIEDLDADDVEATDLTNIEFEPSSDDGQWFILKFYENSKGSEVLAMCEWSDEEGDWHECKPCYRTRKQALGHEEW